MTTTGAVRNQTASRKTTAAGAEATREAQRLLESMFKAGAGLLYISDRMEPEPATRKVLSAPPTVNVELVSILMAFIVETANVPAKTVQQKAAAEAFELLPGLKNWKAPRSDWLPSGVLRVPLWLIPRLLRRKAAWTDESLAKVVKGSRVSKSWGTLAYHKPVIQALVAHVDTFAKRNGLGQQTTSELRKLQVKLDKFTRTQHSRLATWAKKQAFRIGKILQRRVLAF